MIKLYIDIIEPSSMEELKKMILLGERMGYSSLIVDIKNINSYKKVYELSEQTSFPLFPLITKNKKDISNFVGYTIIGTYAENETMLRKNLRDPNTTVITVNLSAINFIITKQTLNIAKQYYKFIEIPLRTLILAPPPERTKLIVSIRNKISILSNKKINILITSRATNIYEMISPHQLRSLLLLIGFKDYTLKKTLKENPLLLISTPAEVEILKTEQYLQNLYKLKSKNFKNDIS